METKWERGWGMRRVWLRGMPWGCSCAVQRVEGKDGGQCAVHLPLSHYPQLWRPWPRACPLLCPLPTPPLPFCHSLRLVWQQPTQRRHSGKGEHKVEQMQGQGRSQTDSEGVDQGGGIGVGLLGLAWSLFIFPSSRFGRLSRVPQQPQHPFTALTRSPRKLWLCLVVLVSVLWSPGVCSRVRCSRRCSPHLLGPSLRPHSAGDGISSAYRVTSSSLRGCQVDFTRSALQASPPVLACPRLATPTPSSIRVIEDHYPQAKHDSTPKEDSGLQTSENHLNSMASVALKPSEEFCEQPCFIYPAGRSLCGGAPSRASTTDAVTSPQIAVLCPSEALPCS